MTGKLKAALVLFCLLWSAAVWSAPSARRAYPAPETGEDRHEGVRQERLPGEQNSSFSRGSAGRGQEKERPSELILIRASGPDIDKAGGLASGMSGSPIYLDGKLAGAFSFGWDYGDPKMGLVTPIEHMTKLFDYKDQVPSFPRLPISARKTRGRLWMNNLTSFTTVT